MDIKFLSGAAVEQAIDALLTEYDEAHWAVAWGTRAPHAKALLAQPKKLVSVTFGLAFSQTDPDLVDAMVGLKGCRVVTKFPSGIYHPKVYAFRSGARAAAIIGSTNFTAGGLGRNHEAVVRIIGSMTDQVLVDALAFTAQLQVGRARYPRVGTAVSPELQDCLPQAASSTRSVRRRVSVKRSLLASLGHDLVSVRRGDSRLGTSQHRAKLELVADCAGLAVVSRVFSRPDDRAAEGDRGLHWRAGQILG